jgi:hypothetical protein
MRAASIVGIQVTSLGKLLARWPRRCLTARPPLRRNDTGDGLGADVGNDLPNRAGRHDPAVRRHAAGATVKNRLIQRAIGAAVAPASIDETGTDPAECSAAVTAVAIHRAEDLRAIRGGCRIIHEGIFHVGRGRLTAACRDVIRISDRRRHAAGAVSTACGRECEQNQRPKIQTMPP